MERKSTGASLSSLTMFPVENPSYIIAKIFYVQKSVFYIVLLALVLQVFLVFIHEKYRTNGKMKTNNYTNTTMISNHNSV